MKNIITIIFFILISIKSIVASSENATKDDIKLLIHQMDKRFDMIIYIMIAGFTIVMGYLLKERYLLKVEIQKELEPKLIRKADKNILDKVISIIEDMATKDKEIEKLLTKHHLKLV